MSKFEILGRFKIGNVWQPFSKYVEGNSEKIALEKVLSLLGSEHGLKRNLIKIDEVRCLE
jgi:large subunit ribosomal protein LX